MSLLSYLIMTEYYVDITGDVHSFRAIMELFIVIIYVRVDGKITLKWFLKKQDGSLHWIHLAQDRGQWRPLANNVMTILLSYNVWNFKSR
jgi:hypothetical protein